MATRYGDLDIGAAIEPLEKPPLTPAMFHAYARSAYDPDPMHLDETFARAAGFPTVFAHGMLIMGYLGELLAARFGPDRIERFKARFADISWPGDRITCRATIAGKRQTSRGIVLELDLLADDQKGEVKVTGTASVLVDM
jgi:acyl dehydratase